MAEILDVKQQLLDFNLSAAENGGIVAVEDADGNVVIGNYFRLENGIYKCDIDGKTVSFSTDGLSGDGSLQLKLVDSGIASSKDATGTRADGTTAEIASLNARDEFAMRALAAMLRGVDKPLNMSDAMIKQYAQKSYKIAAAMMNAAAEQREVASEE